MRIARFIDGTGCRLQAIHGDRFVPRDDDTYLFEMPDGSLKLGTVGSEDAEPFVERFPLRDGFFDSQSGVIVLSV